MTEIAEQRIHSLEQLLSSQPNSPLFAQLADFYLEAGRAQDALRLCDRGLAHHPFYTTGHLIKGKALLALNMKSEARREFELVYESFPLNESVARTLSEIPQGEEETLTAPPPSEPAVPEEPPAPPAAAEPQTEAPPAEAASEELTTPLTETLTSAAELTTETEAEASVEDLFGLTAESGGAPPEAEVSQAETFEQFAERKRGELFGMENSSELEDYLNEAPQQAVAAESAEAPAEEPAAPEAESPSEEPVDPFAMITDSSTPEEQQTTEATEDPFAMVTEPAPPEDQQPTQAPEDPFATLTESVTTEETPEDPFAVLGEPPATAEQPAVEEPAAEQPPPETTDIIPPSPPESQQTTSDEAPEDPFAQLTGTAEEPGQQEPGENQIEEFAEKLKDAKKITPIINLSEKETTPASEQETPSGTGFVTPTLAEIYAKQGWYDDAIKAYKALAQSKPLEREKFEKRIQELEEQKKRQDSIG